MRAIYMNRIPCFQGDARVYKVEPAIKYVGGEADHVAIVKLHWGDLSQTNMWPVSEDGKILDAHKLQYSQHGEHSHESILRAAGYEV